MIIRNLLKTLSIAFIILFLPFTVTAQKKQFSVVDTIVIKNMENSNKKFDIEYFEENKDYTTLTYTKEDGTKIWQYYSASGFYIEKETPPNPKLYIIQRKYYLNGNLKSEGILLPGDLPVNIWRTYDELGNVTEEDMDKEYGAFDYNKVILFLDKKGHIDIKTGRGREDFTIGFNEGFWHVVYWPGKRNGYKPGVYYILDKDTGKVKKQRKVLPSGS